MSAFTQVRDYGNDIRVVCIPCNLEQPYPTYKEANANARAHNVFEHADGIDWAS